MNKDELWKTIEQMELILKRAGYLCDKNFSKKGIQLLLGHSSWRVAGNIFTLIDGRALNIELKFCGVREEDFSIDVTFNTSEIEKHFRETFKEGLTKGLNESKEEFPDRFEKRIMELKLGMVFEKKENYQVESLVKQANVYMERRGKGIIRNKMVHMMMKTLGASTEEELEVKLLKLKGEFLEGRKDEKITLVFAERLTPEDVLYRMDLS